MKRIRIVRLWFVMIAVITFTLSMGVKVINHMVKQTIIPFGNQLLIVSIITILGVIVQILMQHRIYKGFRYFFNHLLICNTLEAQLLDAGFGIERNNYIELPAYQLDFSEDFKTGMLMIRNTLKFDKRLNDIIMSAALRQYIVERHYVSDDGNNYIYELTDGSASFKLIFNSVDAFWQHSKEISTYKLFLDNRNTVKLQHTLLVGMTGSGKTYAAYSLILQMLHKSVPYRLYFADPKGSSLAVIGSAIAEEHTASDIQDIIGLLEEFVDLMRERKETLKEQLINKIDADYSDFNMEPAVFLFDEYAAFAAVIASEDKKTRDHVRSLLYEIILQGRQLGFFMFLIMQKSDASLIDTAIRDNIPLKIVLGNSEQQTYVTAFGTGVNIPVRNYQVGEGVFTEPTLANEPKLVQFPFCDFDILEACKQAPVV